MECRVRDLHVLNYAAGYSMWMYNLREDPLQAALSPGYFDPTWHYIGCGDTITTRSPSETAILTVTRVDAVEHRVSVAMMVSAKMEPAAERETRDAT